MFCTLWHAQFLGHRNAAGLLLLQEVPQEGLASHQVDCELTRYVAILVTEYVIPRYWRPGSCAIL